MNCDIRKRCLILNLTVILYEKTLILKRNKKRIKG